MKTDMTYNIIGDIHGRTCWKNLVREDCVNIFVGDYFDPYEFMLKEQLLSNFQEIIDFKKQHPKTILLYGNHDFHYLRRGEERYSRYNILSAPAYWRAFRETESLFNGIAYPIDNKALVSHAGVTKEWYEKYIGEYHGESLMEIADHINDLWKTDKQAFAFDTNANDLEDCYGTSPTHSPIWIRPWMLRDHNLFAGTDIKQIFGHTQTEGGIMKDRNLIYVDCLGTKEKSYVIET